MKDLFMLFIVIPFVGVVAIWVVFFALAAAFHFPPFGS
jgi:hypothetical protein